MRGKGETRDAKLAALAGRQHGVVARWQLAELGLSDDMVQRRVATGRLFRLHRGVYALTPTVLPRGRMMAAVLAYGPNAVLSHRASAAIWELGPWPSGKIDVTVPRNARARVGTTVHVREVANTVRSGFPVTTLTQTLIDLASVLPFARLEEAFERAERHGLLDVKSVNEQMVGRRGAKKIRRVLAEMGTVEPTRSELERRFRRLCKDHNLPLPAQNVAVHGQDVDAYWAEADVVVELDSWEWHRTRRAFERHRQKAAVLEGAGTRVLRFTWRQLTREPAETAAAIRRALSRMG